MNCHTNRNPINRPSCWGPNASRRYPNDPPGPGIAAPNSLHTMPSQTTITSAASQPSIACGPPSAVNKSGIVINGPIPIMLFMFRAVACTTPKRCGAWVAGGMDGASISTR